MEDNLTFQTNVNVNYSCKPSFDKKIVVFNIQDVKLETCICDMKRNATRIQERKHCENAYLRNNKLIFNELLVAKEKNDII